MIGKQSIVTYGQVLLRVRQSQNLPMQFDGVGGLRLRRPIRIILYKQDLPAQKRAVLIDLEKFKTVAAFSHDVHAPVVVFLCDRENFCSAADFGEIGFLGANHAELLFLFQALSDHFLVAWLEDVQGQWRAGKQNNLKREQREQG